MSRVEWHWIVCGAKVEWYKRTGGGKRRDSVQNYIHSSTHPLIHSSTHPLTPDMTFCCLVFSNFQDLYSAYPSVGGDMVNFQYINAERDEKTTHEHTERALVEMWMLAFSTRLVVSGNSTFGWVMSSELWVMRGFPTLGFAIRRVCGSRRKFVLIGV